VKREKSPRAVPVICLPGEGQFIPIGTTHGGITLKASGGETGGRMTAYEGVLAPNSGGPARHRHQRMDETFYILEGVVTFEVDGRIHEAGVGTHVYVPRETVHAFRNRGAEPARVLVSSVPGGFEGYFAEMQAHGAEAGAWNVEVVGPSLDVE
jgi:mannose-6-phosphate isomerase-like protein (cupin superfamily)